MKYVKRLTSAISIVCLSLILYLEFFNHPPASDTLASNLERTEKDHESHRVPHFHGISLRVGKVGGIPMAAGRGLRSSNVSSDETSYDQGSEGGPSVADSEGSVTAKTYEQGEFEGTGNNRTLTPVNGSSDDARQFHQQGTADWDEWVKNNNYVDIGTIWAYCDEPDPPTIGKITLEKDSKNGGLKYNLDMNATIVEQVEFGKIVFNVELDGVHFATKYFDICEAAIKWEWEVFHCPIKPGNVVFHHEKHIPVYLPSGEYYGESKTTDQSDRTILCGQVKLKL